MVDREEGGTEGQGGGRDRGTGRMEGQRDRKKGGTEGQGGWRDRGTGGGEGQGHRDREQWTEKRGEGQGVVDREEWGRDGEGGGIGRGWGNKWWAVVSPFAVHELWCACRHFYISIIVIWGLSTSVTHFWVPMRYINSLI